MQMILLVAELNVDLDGFVITVVLHLKDDTVIEVLKFALQKG
jgi:hypothetical protein